MRRRYVLALVLATALIFTLGGTAFGRYVWTGEGESGSCIYARNKLEHLATADNLGINDEPILTYRNVYDQHCR